MTVAVENARSGTGERGERRRAETEPGIVASTVGDDGGAKE